jgi:polar amino acid transport system permease protein
MHIEQKKINNYGVMLAAVVSLLLVLWLSALPLRALPPPIGLAAVQFAEGARLTVALTLVSAILGLLLGIVAALGKLSRHSVLRYPSRIYVWVIRGTPLLVQILFVYLALPVVFPQLKLSDFNSAVIALALNVGAYNAEAVRGGSWPFLQARWMLPARWDYHLTMPSSTSRCRKLSGSAYRLW